MAGGDDEILVGSALYIDADETEITEGDAIQFTVTPIALGEDIINIYINNARVYNTQYSGSDILYAHTFNESGEFSVYAEAVYNNIQTQPIVITVEEANITLPTSQVSWEINNKNVQSIFIDNKEVQSIVVEDSGDILFQKSNDIINLPIMELEITGNSFSTNSSTPFTYNSRVFIDWGDNSGIVEYTGGDLTHTYSSSDDYAIKIYGDIVNLENYCFENCTGLTSIVIPDSVISLGEACFYDCSGLTSITIPNSVINLGSECLRNCFGLTSIEIPNSVTSLGDFCFSSCIGLTSISIPSTVTSIGDGCFYGCSGLTSIILNWDTNDEILTYSRYWIRNIPSNLLFYIPNGTTSLYTAKEYPLEELEEIYDEIELTTDKSILSYADNETCTLTAQLLKESTPFMVGGITVEFFNGATSMGTAQTNSNGAATITYSSTGNGDVVFSATGNNLSSEPITIEDCLSTNWSEFITSNYASVNISNGQLSFSNSTAYYGAYIFNSKPDAPYMVELTYVDTSGGNFVFGLGFVNDNYTGTRDNYVANCYYGKTNNDYWGCLANGKSTRPVTGDVYRLEVYEDHIDTYKNNELLKTCTPEVSPFTGRFAIIGTDSPRKQTWKDIKIKLLPSINLVASQSVLSFTDSDSTILTATHSLGTGQTVNLYNASDDSLIGAMTDNEDGTYSYIYNSQGMGDLIIYAKSESIESETVTIEDYWLYDDVSSNKLSNYTKTSNLTVTHDTDHYVLSSSAQNQFLSLLNSRDNIRFEVELRPTSTSTDGTGINVADTWNNFNTSAFLQNASNFGVVFHTNGSWSAGTRQTTPLPNYANYNRYYFEINGSNIKAVCEDLQGNEIYTYSFTKSITNKYLNIVLASSDRTINVNKIKIKAL